MQTISKMLKLCREKCQLTQADLCIELSLFSDEFVSLTPVTLSRWENGVTRASLLRKRLFVKYLISKGLLKSEPFSSIIKERLEALPEPLSVVFDHNYESIIYNYPDFKIDLEGYGFSSITPSTKEETLKHIIDLETVSNPVGYYQTTAEHLRTLNEYPSSESLIIERNGQHLGHLIIYKLKPESAKKLIHHELNEHQLNVSNLALQEERGSLFIHTFFAVNPTIAALINTHAYLHFFEQFENIDDIVVFSCRKDALRLAKIYSIEIKDEGYDAHCNATWYGMSSPVEDILFSDTVLKLVF